MAPTTSLPRMGKCPCACEVLRIGALSFRVRALPRTTHLSDKSLPASDGGLTEAIAALLEAGMANGGGAKGCNKLGVVGVDGADADATANGRGAKG